MTLILDLTAAAREDHHKASDVGRRLDALLFGKRTPASDREAREALWNRKIAREVGLKPNAADAFGGDFRQGAVLDLGVGRIAYRGTRSGALLSFTAPDQGFVEDGALKRRQIRRLRALWEAVRPQAERAGVRAVLGEDDLCLYFQDGPASHPEDQAGVRRRHIVVLRALVRAALQV